MDTLFRNQLGYLRTSDVINVFTGHFLNKTFQIRYIDFFLLHKKLNGFNVDVMLFDLSDKPDVNRITLEQGKCKLICNLTQLLALKDLFNGSMFYIRLQDLLYKNCMVFSKCEPKLENKLLPCIS